MIAARHRPCFKFAFSYHEGTPIDVVVQHAYIKSAREPKIALGPAIDEAMEILSKKGRYPEGEEEEEV